MMFKSAILLIVSLAFVIGACNVSDDPTLVRNNDEDSCESQRAQCSDHGECSEEELGASFSCACDAGYAGDICNSCADGYYNQSSSGLDCVEGSAPTCDGVACGNGSCSIIDNNVTCVCEDDWTGDACDACVEGKLEFVADSGICIADLCAADPCADQPNSVVDSCTMPDESTSACECEAGYLWDGALCEAQCEDVDTDQYGVGPGCLGPDCNDADINVFEDNQQTILSHSVGDGSTRTVTALTTDTVRLNVDHIFTRDPDCPTCTTKIMMAWYSPNTHYIPWGACIAAEEAPLACTAGGTVGSVAIDVPTPNHAGEYELRIVTFSDAEVNCGAAAAALEDDPTLDMGIKVSDVTIEQGMCVSGGNVITNITFNSTETQRYVATPGEQIVFGATYQTAQTGCAGCVRPLAIGMDGIKGGCLYTGVPAQCTSTGTYTTGGTGTLFDPPGTASNLVAPMAPGIYQVGWKAAAVYNCDIGFGDAPAFNTLGVIVVE